MFERQMTIEDGRIDVGTGKPDGNYLVIRYRDLRYYVSGRVK